ncbi:MAG: type IV pilus twitching motility protein PilT [Actinobacteria bacterium]|nr:type IV pilus twitching motility protein PilT [Actinomycetota bacterium]
MDILDLIKVLDAKGGSDLHIKAGSPPYIRVDGVLFPLELPPFSEEDAERLAVSMLNERQVKIFDAGREVDFAYTIPEIGRFRVNVFRQRGSVATAMRKLGSSDLTIEDLGLPSVVKKLASEPRGLILVTGTAGSGKTTTLAAIINHINSTRRTHIVTIEDPIEVVHQDKLSLIDQREIGVDTESYAEALKTVVRQDPNVILIGEMRDAETVGAALSAAEIGNLVLSTLHTVDATETINRIIDFFPPHHQKQIRLMLAATLKGIVSQRLLSKVGGGRIVATEVMVATATVRDYIVKESYTSRILEALEQGEYYGMHSFDQSLLALFAEGKITIDDAFINCANAHDFKLKVQAAGIQV